MFSGNEWIIVVIVALVLFGGSQIPKLARSLGQAQKEFKTGLSEGQRRTTTRRRQEDINKGTAGAAAPRVEARRDRRGGHGERFGTACRPVS